MITDDDQETFAAIAEPRARGDAELLARLEKELMRRKSEYMVRRSVPRASSSSPSRRTASGSWVRRSSKGSSPLTIPWGAINEVFRKAGRQGGIPEELATKADWENDV